MSDWFMTMGYRIASQGRGRLAGIFGRIWYRYYCPYPIIDDFRARACIEGGHCGCDNQSRFNELPAPPPGSLD